MVPVQGTRLEVVSQNIRAGIDALIPQPTDVLDAYYDAGYSDVVRFLEVNTEHLTPAQRMNRSRLDSFEAGRTSGGTSDVLTSSYE